MGWFYHSRSAVMRRTAATAAIAFRRMRVPVAIVIAAAAALRCAGLGTQSFWYDESATAALMRRPLGEVWQSIVHQEITPPLYYGVAWAWTHATGVGEAGVRSLSALCGVATVGVIYLVARDLGGRRAGLLAAVVATVNPLLVWYAQEARSYALVALFAAVSLLALVRWSDRAERRWLVLWSAACALMLLTHYFSCFLVLPEAALLLLRATDRRPVLAACAGWGAVGLALVPLARYQQQDGQAGWISGLPIGDRTELVARELATNNTEFVTQSTPDPAGAWWVLGCAAILAVVALVIVRRRDAPVAARGLGWVALASLGVPYLLSFTSLDYFLDRNLIAAWPLLAVLLGVATARVTAPAVTAAVGAAIAVSGVAVCVSIASDADLQRADWRSAIERIGPADVPRAVLLQPSYAGSELAAYDVHAAIPIPGTGVREVVVLGTQTNAPAAGPQLAAFSAVERAQRGGVGFVRYRAKGLQRLEATAIANAGAGLRYLPTDAARRWFEAYARLVGDWAALAQLAPDRVERGAQTDAAARVAALRPIPDEIPYPGPLGLRLTAAASAATAYGADPNPDTQAALQRAVAAAAPGRP